MQKELATYKKQVSFVQKAADDLQVVKVEDMDVASDLLNQVKKVAKSITEQKELITRPLMTGLAEARNLFKPFELSYTEAEKTIKAKMLTFSIAEDERIEKEKARVEARVEKGTMRVDTAVAKLGDIGDAKTSFGKSSLRKVTKIRIVDESLIPREYLIPDLSKITEAVLRGGQIISGVETYEEKSIVGSTK
jgi:hypothetical protein